MGMEPLMKKGTEVVQLLTTDQSPVILELEDGDGASDEGGNRTSPAAEEFPGILQLEDVDETCDEGENRTSPSAEEPPGILQLIDQLENIVDTLLPG